MDNPLKFVLFCFDVSLCLHTDFFWIKIEFCRLFVCLLCLMVLIDCCM